MFNLNFTQTNGQQLQISIDAGGILFALGANGTGKSSSMQLFFQQSRPNNRRISAHRQTWFSSNTLDLTPAGKRQTETNIESNDISIEARYKDSYAAQRASMTIFDLIDAQNIRARRIAAAVDTSNIEEALKKSLEEAPLKTIILCLNSQIFP